MSINSTGADQINVFEEFPPLIEGIMIAKVWWAVKYNVT